MFAYIQYINNGIKNIVNVKDIKNFDPKNTEDFSPTQAYWILWKGEFFTGQVLLLKDTAEEIEEVLAAGKRIRVPKLLERNPVEIGNSERKELKDSASSQKTKTLEGKQAFLMEIFKERQAIKRRLPLCPTNSKLKRERILQNNESSSETDDELISKSEFDDIKKKHKLLSQKYQEAIKELEDLRKLNTDLQKCLVAKILSGNSTVSAPHTPQTMGNDILPGTVQTTLTTVEINQQRYKEQPSEEGKMHIGEGVYIDRNQWERVQGSRKDSIFVKELAVCIWGTQTLADRSLEGKSCPTTKATPRPPLTPHKFRALKSCFQKRLECQNLEESELKSRVGKLGHYVTEKIQDINKKSKKNKTISI